MFNRKLKRDLRNAKEYADELESLLAERQAWGDQMLSKLTEWNERIEALEAENAELHGVALDLDAQISDMRGVQQGMLNTIKWDAQDRAARAILELCAIPSTNRLNRKARDAIIKLIADVADKI